MANTSNLRNVSDYIVVGIDGTSSREWLRPDGSNSHTYQFIQDFKGNTVTGVNKQWFHGTSDVVMDNESTAIVQQALDFITRSLRRKFPALSINKMRPLEMFDVNSCKQAAYYNELSYESNYYGNENAEVKIPAKVSDSIKHQNLTTEDVKIVLVGHSRGCLAVATLAKMLSPIVQVYFMGLYDSVDRNRCFDSTILENVKYVYHAVRNDEMNSRSTFGHSSTKYAGAVVYTQKSFYTSHGGMGGDYISDPKRDSIAGDKSCIPQPKEITVYSPDGYAQTIDNTHPLTRRFGKPINEICENGKKAADLFIRNGARERALPL
jgi:hypothetical protein